MKLVTALCFCFVLAGCVADAQWFPPGGAIYGRSIETVDDEKCRKFGFEPKSEAYGNCRLQLEQIRAIERSAAHTRARTTPPLGAVAHGGKVYSSEECIGPVVMGRCQGSILPNKAYHPTCHGEWLNGQCTGPLF